jgi:hypothetical protein
MLLVTTSPLQVIFVQRTDIKESGISVTLGWKKLEQCALCHLLLCIMNLYFARPLSDIVHLQRNHSNMFSTKLNDDKESGKGN